jgi:hypothetical protein
VDLHVYDIFTTGDPTARGLTTVNTVTGEIA